jgi:methylphosphotriester-DNA--protein-cysteine methyltransferase
MPQEGRYTVRYTNVDCMPQSIAGSPAAAIPVRGGPFLLEATGIGLGDLDVLVGRHTPLLLHGMVPMDRVWAVFPITPFRINGRCAAPPMLAMLGAGAVLDCANHAEADWALVSLHVGLAERALDVPGRSPRLGLGAQAMLACDPEVWLQSIQLLQSAVEVAAEDAAVFEVAEARRSLRSSVLEMLQDLLTGISSGVRPRTLRASAERRWLSRAVEDLLRANPEQVATAAGLAAALGVSAPRLRRAVRAHYGMGLQRFLLLRRLMRFHKALRSVRPSGPALRQIALTHGFSNLRHLEREYQAIFSADFSHFDRGDGASSGNDAAMLRLAAD